MPQTQIGWQTQKRVTFHTAWRTRARFMSLCFYATTITLILRWLWLVFPGPRPHKWNEPSVRIRIYGCRCDIFKPKQSMFSLKLNNSGWCSQWHHVLSGSLSQIQLLSLKIYRTIHFCLYCMSTWCFLTTSVVEAETMRDNENARGASFLLCSDICDECADYFASMAHTEDDLCLRRENYRPQCPHREGPCARENTRAESTHPHRWLLQFCHASVCSAGILLS